MYCQWVVEGRGRGGGRTQRIGLQRELHTFLMQTHDILHATFTHCAHVRKGVMQGCTQPCLTPSSCPTHLAGRPMAPLSCSVEAVSAAQTPSHLRPPSWPSCPPLLPPGGDHHHPPPAPVEETLRLVDLEGRSQVPLPLPLPLLIDTILLDGG